MKVPIGYCTNVHAGANLDQTRGNIERYAVAVRRHFSPDRPMGLGLWLSASAARQMIEGGQLEGWRDWLAELGLVPFTFNGFPYGDFHQRVVKHQVYLPTWWQPERLAYTLDLIDIQHALLPDGLEGSISTLPIVWGDPPPEAEQLRSAGQMLRSVAGRLARLEAETRRLIYLCLEPEPGCVIQRSDDLVRFFDAHLPEATHRRYLRVCHDICHQAIMFEDQADVLRRYETAGIAVGKVQVSSAVVLPLDRLPLEEHTAALALLAGFNEERYLHQTVIRTGSGAPVFHQDLPLALASPQIGEWRVHFHVPVYLERFGRLETTQFAIRDCLRAIRGCQHFEVETYAWGVLPTELQQPDLARGIADEMHWLQAEMQ
jgi:hypothetical protein